VLWEIRANSATIGLLVSLVLAAAGLESGMKVDADLFLGLSTEKVAGPCLCGEFLIAKKKYNKKVLGDQGDYMPDRLE